MGEEETAATPTAAQTPERIAEGLATAVYACPDPTEDEALFGRYVDAISALVAQARERPRAGRRASGGRMLGPETTGARSFLHAALG